MNDARQVRGFPNGIVNVPPSKSIAHRAIICAALAQGESVIKNVQYSEDINATCGAAESMFCDIDRREDSLVVKGGKMKYPKIIDCGESAATLRLMMPSAAAFCDEIAFTGRGRLMQRPLGAYLDALSEHGAGSSLKDGILMLKGRLTPGVYKIRGDISSQYISGLLLALAILEADSEIILTTPLQSAPYVELTVDMMKRYGAEISHDNFERFFIRGNQRYQACDTALEADYSQAAFFLVAGALGCDCEVSGLDPDSKQGDKKILEILKNSGADVTYTPDGNIKVTANKLKAQTVDASDIPDLVPPVAVLMALSEGESMIINAQRLRYKESDRLESVAQTLGAFGADIRIEDGGLVINGAERLKGGVADSFNDHRIAMMSALAAIKADGAVTILGSGSVNKSFPDFWEKFERSAKD